MVDLVSKHSNQSKRASLGSVTPDLKITPSKSPDKPESEEVFIGNKSPSGVQTPSYMNQTASSRRRTRIERKVTHNVSASIDE